MNSGQISPTEALQIQAQPYTGQLQVTAQSDGVRVVLTDPRLEFIHSFVTGPFALRARQSSQALLRACNNKQRNIRHLLDLTAGWGVDSFTLASHGLQVTLLEHNPLVAAIVACSLERLAQTPNGSKTAQRLELRQQDAGDYLQALAAAEVCDCIYIDPMFPAHKSGAKPGKEMQILQRLTGNLDIDLCFDLALQKAGKRVVVKRPARAALLGAAKPDLVYREKTVRFDVYLTA